MLDASYVASFNRHNSGSISQDVQPYGIQWLNTSAGYDRTGKCTDGTLVYGDTTKGGCTLLPAVFMNYPGANGYTIQHANDLGISSANLPGYSGVSLSYDNINSNYNSLQTQVSKRFGRTLTMNLAWTYAKTLGWSEPSLMAPKSVWHDLYYNQSGPKHNIVANWTYHLPDPRFHGFMEQALGGWVVEGIFNYTSGTAGSVGAGTGVNYNGGGGYGTRVSLVPGKSVYNKSGAAPNSTTPLREQYLNLAAFSAPRGGQAVCDGTAANCGFGNSGKINYIGPATNNWNMSIFKDFHFSSNEARKFEFRLETYNTFNHTEFTTLNTSARALTANAPFDPASNNTFGRFTATAAARIIALSGKLMF